VRQTKTCREIKDSEEEEARQFQKAEVKFAMCQDALIKNEENRDEQQQVAYFQGDPSYHVSLEFSNIKAISFVTSTLRSSQYDNEPDSIQFKILIHLANPGECHKRYFAQKGRPSPVRSPFNMLGTERAWEGSEFLNYWNLN
jgi:hypothetical protein